MIVGSKLETKEKEAFVTYLKEMFRYLLGITEGNCKKAEVISYHG
jgi:hypothetical protein